MKIRHIHPLASILSHECLPNVKKYYTGISQGSNLQCKAAVQIAADSSGPEKFDCEDIFKKHSREAEVNDENDEGNQKKIFPFHEEVGGIGRREYIFRFLDLD